MYPGAILLSIVSSLGSIVIAAGLGVHWIDVPVVAFLVIVTGGMALFAVAVAHMARRGVEKPVIPLLFAYAATVWFIVALILSARGPVNIPMSFNFSF